MLLLSMICLFCFSSPVLLDTRGLFWPRKSCLFPQPALFGWGLQGPRQVAWTLGVSSKCTRIFQEDITSPWSCFQNPVTADGKGFSYNFFVPEAKPSQFRMFSAITHLVTCFKLKLVRKQGNLKYQWLYSKLMDEQIFQEKRKWSYQEPKQPLSLHHGWKYDTEL